MAAIARKSIFAIAGAGIYCGSVYVFYHTYKLYNSPSQPAECSLQSDYSFRFDELNDYDSKVNWDEFWMGLGRLRKDIGKLCNGNVLEIAAGTGRNLEYYTANVSSVTLIDSSRPMLQLALEKYRRYRSKFPAIFQVMDCQQLSFKDDSFDTVVQSFGLCSHSDPSRSLNEMKRVLKPGGQIILLEHGRSDYAWLNGFLDKTAENHAKSWGCWWNRDIIKLINNLGMKIVQLDRYHFGTTIKIVLEKG